MKIEVESEALDTLKAMAQRLQNERDELLGALKAIDKECFSHVDGRDLFAQMHPRNMLDIKRRVDARETWFEGDWLTDLWGEIKKSTFHHRQMHSRAKGDGMNREKIIEIARECGLHYWDMDNLCFQQSQDIDLLEAFASAIRAATKEEDARICEDSQKGDARKQSRYETARKIADAIRASK